MKDSILRSALADILKGFSFKDGIYIKHTRLEDYVDYENVEESYFKMLQKRGMETEEQLMGRAIKQGLWSQAQEDEMKDLASQIEAAKKTIEKLVIKAQTRDIEELLRKNEAKYFLLSNKKFSFISHSCERKTAERVNEYYILKSLYKDEEFKTPYLTEEEKDDPDLDILKFIRIHKEATEKCSESNIKWIAIKQFFRDSWELTEDAYHYFGTPLSKITYRQSHLATYANIFGNIFQRFPDIQRDDPEKILLKARSMQEMSKKGHKDGKTTIVGATEEEAREMGIQQPDRTKQFEEARKKWEEKQAKNS